MITVIDYAKRQRKDGTEFIALILQGGLSLVQSRNTGNFYATVKRCSIPSTFDEETAKAMVGERVAGSVQKTQCDPYEFTPKDSDEVITLDYRWVYVPEGATVEEAVYEGEPEVVEPKKKEKLILSRA